MLRSGAHEDLFQQLIYCVGHHTALRNYRSRASFTASLQAELCILARVSTAPRERRMLNRSSPSMMLLGYSSLSRQRPSLRDGGSIVCVPQFSNQRNIGHRAWCPPFDTSDRGSGDQVRPMADVMGCVGAHALDPTSTVWSFQLTSNLPNPKGVL